MSLQLITDRTQADYEEWLELSQIPWASMTDEQRGKWSVPMKGAYNYTDLNRVGNSMCTLQTLFTSYGYKVTIKVRTDYKMGEWPTKADMDHYIQSLKNLRAVLTVAESTPTPPDSMDYGTVFIWNNIEKILVDLEDALERIKQSWFYSGEIGCGEV